MTPLNVATLLLGSAVISGIIAALITGVFNALLQRAELRESRLAIAATLTQLNQERYIEAGRNSAGTEVSLQDPASVMRFYLAEVDAMAKDRSGGNAKWTDPVSYRRGGAR
jgi:hypothetical protein